MRTLEELHSKAEWEGGIWELIFSYGVDTKEWKETQLEPLIPLVEKVKKAGSELSAKLDEMGWNDFES